MTSAMPVQCSNQLSYEVTQLRAGQFAGLMLHFFHTGLFLLLLSYIIHQVSYDHRSYERNLSNCVEKPEKVRTSMGFEPVTLRGHHSLLDFKIRSSIYETFHISLHIHTVALRLQFMKML